MIMIYEVLYKIEFQVKASSKSNSKTPYRISLEEEWIIWFMNGRVENARK